MTLAVPFWSNWLELFGWTSAIAKKCLLARNGYDGTSQTDQLKRVLTHAVGSGRDLRKRRLGLAKPIKCNASSTESPAGRRK